MALCVQVESLENRFGHQIEIWDPIYASYIVLEICAISYLSNYSLSTFWKVSISSFTNWDYVMSKKNECEPRSPPPPTPLLW